MQDAIRKWMVVISLLAIVGGRTAVGSVTNLWEGTDGTDWFNPANWSETAVPGASAHVRIPAGTPDAPVLTNATAALASLTLDSGAILTVEGWDSAIEAVTLTVAGTITHANHDDITEPDNGEWPVAHRVLLIGSNITITATGILDGDYLGYPGAAGPGSPTVARSGAGHAGLGGIGYDSIGAPGPMYGNPEEPFQPGSGGGSSDESYQGGGVIRVVAEGHLQVDGMLTVNGRNGSGLNGGGSSGGSIWLNCRTFSGAGLLRANGGDGGSRSGAGSGGRMALHYDTQLQQSVSQSSAAFRFQAHHGESGSTVHTDRPAEMGTLYLSDTYLLPESLPAQRFQHVRLTIPGFTEWTPSSLTVNGCAFGLPPGFLLSVQQDLVLSNGAALYLFAAPVNDPMTEDGTRVDVGGDLRLSDDAWIFPTADSTNGATVAFAITGDLFVDEDSGFDADNRGFLWQHGPGQETAYFESFGSGVSIGTRGGAGHGGRGGAGDQHDGGNIYGDPAAPRLPGSGSPRDLGGFGGGAIRITVGGHAEINGLLTADAARTFYRISAGSGSGGSIWLTSHTIGGSHTGLLHARGGNAASHRAGAGGGGRIAVHYDPIAQAQIDPPDIRFSAPPGAESDDDRLPRWGAGTAGTLYLPDALWLKPMIEAGQFMDIRLVIPDFTQWSPDALTVAEGEFSLPAGLRVEIVGDLTLQTGARLHVKPAPTNSVSEIFGAFLDVGGDLRIESGAWLYPHADMTNGATVGIQVAGDVVIEADGGIDADARGYMAMGANQSGPGAGQNETSGGGHGGTGGGDAGGAIYGDAALPLAPGSPGGWRTGSDQLRSGQGGGAITLMAGGIVQLDGEVRANAEALPDSVTATAGSGGGIFLAGRRVTGSGALLANGAAARAGTDVEDAQGGGGRIAVWIGVPLDTVVSSIAANTAKGVTRFDTYPTFNGDVLVNPGGTAAEAGTFGFYVRRGTLFLLR